MFQRPRLAAVLPERLHPSKSAYLMHTSAVEVGRASTSLPLKPVGYYCIIAEMT